MSPSQAEATPEQRHQLGAEAGRTQVLRTAIGGGDVGSRRTAKQLSQPHLPPGPPVPLPTPQKDVYLNTL